MRRAVAVVPMLLVLAAPMPVRSQWVAARSNEAAGAQAEPIILTQGKEQDKDKKDKKDQPAPDPFVQAPPETVAAPIRVAHHVMGDWPGGSALKTFTIPTTRAYSFLLPVTIPGVPGQVPPVVVFVPGTANLPGTLTNTVRVPI